MLYAHDDRNNSVSLRLMVQKIVNEYEVTKNTVFIKQVTTVIHEASKLHKEQITIYEVNSSFFQEIVFLSNTASEQLLEHIDNLEKAELEELLRLLNQIK